MSAMVVDEDFAMSATLLENLRNAIFCDGDRMSFLLPDYDVRCLNPPSDFGTDVKMEVLLLSLGRE